MEMAQIGDSKGEYRGTQHRNDADLKAWLGKRPSEAALPWVTAPFLEYH
jgi:DNA transposition AAA+ family ATPase